MILPKQNTHAIYKEAIKEATNQLAAAQKGPNSGKKEYGPHATTNKINKKQLVGESKKLLNHQTVQNAIDLGIIGDSLPKMKQPPKILQQATNALTIHSTMLQV